MTKPCIGCRSHGSWQSGSSRLSPVSPLHKATSRPWTLNNALFCSLKCFMLDSISQTYKVLKIIKDVKHIEPILDSVHPHQLMIGHKFLNTERTLVTSWNSSNLHMILQCSNKSTIRCKEPSTPGTRAALGDPLSNSWAEITILPHRQYQKLY